MKETILHLAFEYKKTKLWHRLSDIDVFAVELDNHSTGYISIMGNAREHTAISLYPNEKAFQTYLHMLNAHEHSYNSPFDAQETLLSQDCLQLSFEESIELLDDELKEVQTFKKKHGIRVGGKKAHPSFRTYRPYHIPQQLTSESDMNLIRQAIEASIFVANLDPVTQYQFLNHAYYGESPTVPLLAKQADRYVIKGTIQLPYYEMETYPMVDELSSFTQKRLMKLPRVAKKREVIQCNLVMLPNPVQEEGSDRVVFPHALLSVVERTGEALAPIMTLDYQEKPEIIVSDFIQMLLDRKILPEKIIVKNVRTYDLLDVLTEYSDILISEGNTFELDVFEMDFYENMMDEEPGAEVDAFIELLLTVDAAHLVDLPVDMLAEFEEIVLTGAFPEDLSNQLLRKLNLIKKLRR